jgi:phosphate uptake regulator
MDKHERPEARRQPEHVRSARRRPPAELGREQEEGSHQRAGDRLTAKQRKVIRDFVHKVIGTEIVEETANTVTVQDLIDTGELSIERSIRRISLIVDSMFNDAIIALKQGDKELAEDIFIRDDDVDRLYWLISKQFHMLLNQPQLTAQMEIMPIEASFLRSAGKNLENDFDDVIIKKIVKNSKMITDMINGAVKAVLRRDFELANDTIEDMKPVMKGCAELLSMIPRKKKATVNLAYIIESMERIASYSTDIAEVAINMTALPSPKSK